MAGSPSAKTALKAARVAREAGNLRVALRALGYVYEHLHELPEYSKDVAREGERLARELAGRGAALAALGEAMRAQELGRDLGSVLGRLQEDYPSWRPELSSVGAPKDGLTAGASGTFWVGRHQRARILALKGGITGEGTQAFSRVLELSSQDVQWLLVDMERLSYVGSTGLAVVVKTAERLKSREQGGVSLFQPSSNLKLLVETLGLATFLNPVHDLVASLELVGPSRSRSR